MCTYVILVYVALRRYPQGVFIYIKDGGKYRKTRENANIPIIHHKILHNISPGFLNPLEASMSNDDVTEYKQTLQKHVFSCFSAQYVMLFPANYWNKPDFDSVRQSLSLSVCLSVCLFASQSLCMSFSSHIFLSDSSLLVLFVCLFVLI